MSSIRFYQGELHTLLNSPTGPVAKDLLRRTIKVETAAKRLCPVDTGRLRASVTHRIGADARGVVGVVGTDVKYAPYVELGTIRSGPHPFLRPALSAAR